MFGASNTNNGNMRDVNMRDTHMRDTNMRDVHHNNKFNNRRYRTTMTGNIYIFNFSNSSQPKINDIINAAFLSSNHKAMDDKNGNELAALYQEPLVSSDGDAEFVNSVDAESDGLLNILYRSSSPLPTRRLPLFVLEEIEREEKKNVIDVPCKKCGDPMQKFENSWKVYQNHFGWICDGCEKDKNSVEEIYHCECIKDGYDLCQECVNTMDINENKKRIDEPDSDSDSDYNDPDESPSSRSGKRKVSDLSNLYRDNSDNTWSSEDIEDLHNEMSQQLVDLSKQIINEEMHQVHKQHSLHSPIFVPLIASNASYNYNNCNDISLSNSNLFCDAMVEKEKEEMEKQIKHLVTLNPQFDHTEM